MKQASVLPEVEPINTREGCICRNNGKPVGGFIFVSPNCKVHYAESGIPRKNLDPKYKAENWKDREKRPRVHYPKMTVARP